VEGREKNKEYKRVSDAKCTREKEYIKLVRIYIRVTTCTTDGFSVELAVFLPCQKLADEMKVVECCICKQKS
jgi:hypothetical protein